MEAGSVKDLTAIVEQVERTAERIRSLRIEAGAVVPDIPLPLSLSTMMAWLDDAEECCRRPLLARSKQLLESKGISTADIPTSVLSNPDLIVGIVKLVEELNSALRKPTYESVGRALTKGIGDATSVVQTFASASHELDRLASSRDWVVALALTDVVSEPTKASEVVDLVKRVEECINAAEAKGVQVPRYTSLNEALRCLTDVMTRIHAYANLLKAEGVPDDRSIAGKGVEDAIKAVNTATEKLKTEKEQLTREASALCDQIVSLGGRDERATLSTVSELRAFVSQLRESVRSRRRALRESLGASTFRVVEHLAQGALPKANEVSDQELGIAIRKAVSSGYRLQLEVPHEDS